MSHQAAESKASSRNRTIGLGVAFAALLLVSLAGKGAGLTRSHQFEPDDDTPVLTFLEDHGLTVQPPYLETSPVWLVGTRDACRARITGVPPEGWARAIVAEQTAGDHLMYAFDGLFFDEQPVARTMIENYRRRLMRYFGREAPKLQIRAIAVSPECPADLLRPEDAKRLSN